MIAADSFVDVLAAGCDAGIRDDERLEVHDRSADRAASPTLRHGRLDYPRDLLGQACLRGRFSSGTMITWEFEREGEVVRIDPAGPLLVSVGSASDLAVEAAVAGTGIITLFEDWLRPHLDNGALRSVLEPW